MYHKVIHQHHPYRDVVQSDVYLLNCEPVGAIYNLARALVKPIVDSPTNSYTVYPIGLLTERVTLVATPITALIKKITVPTFDGETNTWVELRGYTLGGHDYTDMLIVIADFHYQVEPLIGQFSNYGRTWRRQSFKLDPQATLIPLYTSVEPV